MPDQPTPASAPADSSGRRRRHGAAGDAPKPKPARKRRTAASADELAARLAGLADAAADSGASPGPPARQRTSRASRAQTQAQTQAQKTAARPGGRTTAAVKGTRSTNPAPMAAEQARPAAYYSARVSHATTPGQLAELEQIRVTENAARRAARRPALSVTALLRAAAAICLENDRLRAQMIKRAGEEWN